MADRTYRRFESFCARAMTVLAERLEKDALLGDQDIADTLREIISLHALNDSGNMKVIIPDSLRISREKFTMQNAISEFEAGRWGVRKMVTCKKCRWPWFPKQDPDDQPPMQCPRCKADEPLRGYVRPRPEKED